MTRPEWPRDWALRIRPTRHLALRIYRVTKDESIRVGARAAPETVALRYTCAHGTVQAAGP